MISLATQRTIMNKRVIYAGLAGDSDPGRFLSHGLYRAADVEGRWESIGDRIHPRPEVRAIVTDPAKPGRVTVGTQLGIFRSEDHGEAWVRLPSPRPGIAIWSLRNHPTEPDTLLAGAEPAAIFRSRDDGRTWETLVLSGFPAVTEGPDMPKRVTGITVDPDRPTTLFASIEIGGLLRSQDDGQNWVCVTDGLYVNEDSVDLHDVSISEGQDGLLTVAARVGAFQSADGGEHWHTLTIPALRPRGTYCRALARMPGNPNRLYLGAGNDFDGDIGALLASEDGGRSWQTIALPGPLKTTVFALAVDPRTPSEIYCATKYGHVFGSTDGGVQWRAGSLPAGAGHIFALAVG
jgi:photosystem II stability/assembly factor-like uncharacterized protein